MRRFGRLRDTAPTLRLEDLGDQRAKARAIRRLIGEFQQPIGTAIGEMRRMSLFGSSSGSESQSPLPPGLVNEHKVTCYENGVLQALASIPSFRRHINMTAKGMPGPCSNTTQCLNRVFTAMHTPEVSDRSMWVPRRLKFMDQYEQQDAQEYFGQVMEAIEKEMTQSWNLNIKKPGFESLRKKRKFAHFEEKASTYHTRAPSLSDSSSSHDIMTPGSSEDPEEGEIRTAPTPALSTLPRFRLPKNPLDFLIRHSSSCDVCGTEEDRCQQEKYISVNLDSWGGSVDIQQLLTSYLSAEEVNDVECDKCTQREQDAADAGAEDSDQDPLPPRRAKKVKPIKVSKTKQATFARLPKVLAIHINRSFFTEDGASLKLGTMVEFPATLRIQTRWCTPFEPFDRFHPFQDERYALKATVLHFGRGHEAGHYIAYGRRGNSWYQFDDQRVLEYDLEDVLEDQRVFMLFYELIEPEPEPDLPERRPRSATAENMETVVEMPVASSDSSNSSPPESTEPEVKAEAEVSEEGEAPQQAEAATRADPLPSNVDEPRNPDRAKEKTLPQLPNPSTIGSSLRSYVLQKPEELPEATNEANMSSDPNPEENVVAVTGQSVDLQRLETSDKATAAETSTESVVAPSHEAGESSVVKPSPSPNDESTTLSRSTTCSDLSSAASATPNADSGGLAPVQPIVPVMRTAAPNTSLEKTSSRSSASSPAVRAV